MQERSEAEPRAIRPCLNVATWRRERSVRAIQRIRQKFDRIPFDPCNSIKRFDLCPFDQKNSTYLQPPEDDRAEFERYLGLTRSTTNHFRYFRSFKSKQGPVSVRYKPKTTNDLESQCSLYSESSPKSSKNRLL